MANFNFVTAGGGEARLATRDSSVMGPSLEARDSLLVGTVFRPATAADRDALVNALNAMDYTAKTYHVILAYDVPGEGTYRVNARRTDTRDELDAWVETEREAMAKRLGLKDPQDITLTITEI